MECRSAKGGNHAQGKVRHSGFRYRGHGVRRSSTGDAGVRRADVHGLGTSRVSEPVDITLKVRDGKSEVIHVPASQDTVIQQIVLAPGGQTGWHSHPGPAIALIKGGELTLYDGDDPRCSSRSYGAGQAFIDGGQGHAHIARNLSTTDNAEVWVTYLDVSPDQSTARIDQPSPGNCTF